ncbi:arsenate-mycothiol transferase ArsC [Geodermatophilus nigrescens]
MSERPKVLFVCVKNAGKSQMAAGLMSDYVGDAAEVSSAGTQAGTSLNELSVQSLAEVGVDISAEQPKALTEQMVRDADVVVTLGQEAHVAPVEGTRIEQWITEEPSERGIDGIERMRLVRNDIAAHVRRLACDLGAAPRRDVGADLSP